MNLKELVDRAILREKVETEKKRELERNYALQWLKENDVNIDNIDQSQYPLVIDGANVIIAERIGTRHTYIRALTVCSTCKKVTWTEPHLSINNLAKAIAAGDACNEHVSDECMVKNKEIPMLEAGYPVPPSWRKK